ncbi:hypothetical protein VTN31DRAFT_5781 [Thermomyces dupontii]|uniref:uncharacterized protein n=1 Tax=Talaromyces thermophilus TaxID=28565 RepID=UPI0037435D21
MQTIALPADCCCENSIHWTNRWCRPAIPSCSHRPFSVTIFSHRNSIHSSTPDGPGRLLYTREDPGGLTLVRRGSYIPLPIAPSLGRACV